MAIAVTFDTFKFVETLEKAGVPEQQAKAQLEAVTVAINANAHTLGNDHEEELKQVEARLEAKTDQVETNLNAKIDKVEANLEAKIDKLDAKIDKIVVEFNGKFALIHWMLGFLLAGTFTILAGIFTLIVKQLF